MKTRKTSTLLLVLIPICIAINVVGGQFASTLKLPLYLDSIGTMWAGMLCGPFYGGLVGALTGVVTGVFSPIMLAYIPVTCVYGIAAALLSRGRMMCTWPRLLISGAVIALLGVALGSPITAFIFNGITETGQSVIIALLRSVGFSLLSSTLISSFFSEFIDKLLAASICFLIVKSMSERYLVRLPLGSIYIKCNKKKEQKGYIDKEESLK